MLDNAYDREDGILSVAGVQPGSLAERGGVRLDDRIEKWNRRFIQSREEYMQVPSPLFPSCLSHAAGKPPF